MSADPVLDLCDACCGDGFIERGEGNNPDATRTDTCTWCDGTGFILRDGEEMDMSEADEIDEGANA